MVNRAEELNIGDKVEIFSIEEDGEHIELEGTLVAVFRSGWDGNLSCVVEHVGNHHIVRTVHRKRLRAASKRQGVAQ